MPQHTEEERKKRKLTGTENRLSRVGRGIEQLVTKARTLLPKGPTARTADNFEEVLGAQGVPLVIPKERGPGIKTPITTVLGRSERVAAPPKPVSTTPIETTKLGLTVDGEKGGQFSRIQTTGDIVAPEITPIAETPEAAPRFVADGVGIRKRDITPPKEFRDLGIVRERIVQDLRLAGSPSERAQLTKQLTDVTGRQNEIRRTIELGISERIKAEAPKVEGKTASKVQSALLKAQNEAARLAISKSKAESEIEGREFTQKATIAGARPKLENFFGDVAAHAAAVKEWEDRLGVGTKTASTGTTTGRTPVF
ncbi:MAG: hypothetical protein V3U97_03225 [bacterium]